MEWLEVKDVEKDVGNYNIKFYKFLRKKNYENSSLIEINKN